MNSVKNVFRTVASIVLKSIRDFFLAAVGLVGFVLVLLVPAFLLSWVFNNLPSIIETGLAWLVAIVIASGLLYAIGYVLWCWIEPLFRPFAPTSRILSEREKDLLRSVIWPLRFRMFIAKTAEAFLCVLALGLWSTPAIYLDLDAAVLPMYWPFVWMAGWTYAVFRAFYWIWEPMLKDRIEHWDWCFLHPDELLEQAEALDEQVYSSTDRP